MTTAFVTFCAESVSPQKLYVAMILSLINTIAAVVPLMLSGPVSTKVGDNVRVQFNSQCGTMTFISVCNEPPRSTQPGHSCMVRHNKYQPKGGEWVSGKTV